MSQSTLKPINILGTQSKNTTPFAMTPTISGQMSTKNPMTSVPSGFPDNLKPQATATSSEANLMAERFQNESRIKQPDLTALRRFTVDQIFAMDDSVAENLYFNGEVGEDVDKHKENVEKALFFVSGSQKQLDKNTGTYPVESSHYEDGVYINNLATL